jgi:hypothetical protein
LESLEIRDCLEDLDLGGRTILKGTLRKQDSREWTGLIWLRTGYKWRSSVNTEMNIRVPSKAGNLWTIGENSSFSRAQLHEIS